MTMENLGRRTLGSDAGRTGVVLVLMVLSCSLIAAGLLALPASFTITAALALVGAVAILCNPYWGLVLFLAVLFVRVEVFLPEGRIPGTDITTFKLASWLTMSLALFGWMLQVILKRETVRWRAELGWMVALILTLASTAVRVHLPDGGMALLMEIGKTAAVFLVLQQLMNSERRVYLGMHWFLLFAVCLSLIGAYGWFTGTHVWMENGMPRASVAGDYKDPNGLGACLATAAPIGLFLALRRGSLPVRLWGLLGLLIVVTGIYLSNSRGGMLALAVGTCVLLVNQIGWARGIMIAGLALGLMVTCGTDRFSNQPFTQRAVAGDESAMGRIRAWEAGLEMWERQPLLGVGHGQFVEYHIREAHNQFVQVLAEAGFVGAFLWVGLTYWALLTAVRLRRTRNDDGTPTLLSGPAIALQAALLASLTAGRTLHRAYSFDHLIPIAWLSALGYFVPERSTSPWRNWIHYTVILAVTLTSIGMMYLVVRFLG
jgi:putative inorganic carbon (hco3(-)) transporter